MEPVAPRRRPAAAEAETTGGGNRMEKGDQRRSGCGGPWFRMPLNYPRYTREDYEAMPEWQLDRLLAEYGLPVSGNVVQKRS